VLVLAYRESASGSLYHRYYDNAGTLKDTQFLTANINATSNHPWVQEISSKTTGDRYVCTVWYDSTVPGVVFHLREADGTSHISTTTILSGSWTLVAAGAICDTSRPTDDDVTFFMDTVAAGGDLHTLYVSTCNIDGTGVVDTITSLRHAHLAVKPFILHNRLRVIVSYLFCTTTLNDYGNQDTYFVMSLEGPSTLAPASHHWVTDSILLPAEATSDSISRDHLVAPVLHDDGGVSATLTRAVLIPTALAVLASGSDHRSVVIATITPETKRAPIHTVENSLLAGGSLPYWLDGRSQELGMLLRPEIDDTWSMYNGAGGLNNNGAYSWVAVYEWRDRDGKLHRSAPSDPLTLTLGATHDTVDINVTQLKFTASREKQLAVNIVLYRTTDGGSSYYRTDDEVDGTFTDVTSDADLVSREELYTDGGELPTMPVLPFLDVASNGEYVFIVPQEDPYRVVFSKPLMDGTLAPEFTADDLFHLRFPDGGPNVAVECMDQITVVFKAGSIYAFQGVQGPNAQGLGTFPPARLISRDVGCTNRESVSQINAGITFQSNNQIWLLRPDMSLLHISDPVDELIDQYLDSEPLVSVVDVDASVVLFCGDNSDGRALAWDWEYGQWSLYTGHRAVDLTVHDGQVVRLEGDSVYRYIKDLYQDDFEPYSLRITTPWIKVGSIQGYQRARWIHLLGSKHSGHTLNAEMCIDYNETVVESWDHDIKVDVAGVPLAKRHKPREQKCTALKLTLSDSKQVGTCESYDLSGLSLSVGHKGRLRPVEK
jgi:hypothetical protein